MTISSRSFTRRLCLAAACLAVAFASGCASRVDVRGIGSGNAPPFYELRGHSLAALDQQAAAICPDGYGVARRWQRVQPADKQSGYVARGQMFAEDFLLPKQSDAAQMTIQCNVGQPTFVPEGAPPPPPPPKRPSSVSIGPLAVVGDGDVATKAPGAAKPLTDKAPAANSAAPGAAADPAKEAGKPPAGKVPASAAPPAAAKPSDRKTSAAGAGAKSPFSVPPANASGKGAM